MPMEPITELRSLAHVIDQANIDTDVIYPARFLLVLDRDGIGRYAFHDWRKGSDGLENPAFPAPELTAGTRSILIAGPNFGCGSSREHAVWTLADLGIRCIVAPSFGEIFYNNCFKNGVLPLVLDDEAWEQVRNAGAAGEELFVDLQGLRLFAGPAGPLPFQVPGFYRDALLNGWDEIDTVLAADAEAISAFESRRQAAVPWLFRDLDS